MGVHPTTPVVDAGQQRRHRPKVRYAAFLRGINLGRRRVVGGELRAAFAGLGFTEVDSFLASGNVVFDADPGDGSELVSRIEAALQAALGYQVLTFLRTGTELGSIVCRTPFGRTAVEGSAGKLQVMLLRAEPTSTDAAAVLALGPEDDRLAICGRELYWLPAGNMSESNLDMRALERLLGPTTTRTANTLDRLYAKYFADPNRA